MILFQWSLVMKKIIAIFVVILSIFLLTFLVVFSLAKTKIIFINKWFVDEKKNTIGVDVSSYQGKIDFQKLKEQNIAFAYIKATEGSTYKDKMFQINWRNSKNVGILSGAYHFFSFDSSGKLQAENFIQTIGCKENLTGRLVPVVDVEYYGNKEENPPKEDEVIRELKIFLDKVELQYKIRPMIYTRSDVYDKYLKKNFNSYKYWISSLYTPLSWNYKDDWYIWQYFNRGILNGYEGEEKYIDLNVLNIDKKLSDLIVN